MVIERDDGFAKNVSWPWLSQLRGWGSLAITFLCKFGYLYLTILFFYSPVAISYSDWKWWLFQHSMPVADMLISRGCLKRFLVGVYTLRTDPYWAPLARTEHHWSTAEPQRLSLSTTDPQWTSNDLYWAPLTPTKSFEANVAST